MKRLSLTLGIALLASAGHSQTSILLADINQTTTGIGSGPAAGKWMGSTYYFTANDGVNGIELWKSDGTLAGTTLLKDINIGNGSSSPAQLTVVGSTLFFVANDGVTGAELWKTDGTTAGTVLVKDIRAGGTASQCQYLTSFNGSLVFTANDGLRGDELWKSDGTTSGTTLITEIMSGSVGGAINRWAAASNFIYFCGSYQTSGNYELWKTDGTASGTVFVKEVYSDPNTGGVTNSFFVHNDILYFGGWNGAVTNAWRSDGTSGGTYEYKSYSAGANPGSYAAIGNTVFVTMNDANGTELWKTDGTVGGTSMVKDIESGSTGSSPTSLTVVGSTLYFRATTTANGQELWKSDGTSSGTVLVKEINAGNANAAPANLLAWNGALYFAANDGTGLDLWKSDGIASGTTMLKDINPTAGVSSNPTALTAGSSFFFLTADNGTNGTELFKSDGTTAGTTLLKNISPETGASAIATMTALSGKIVFNANNGTTGAEPWVTNGLPGGTTLLKDINTSAAAASSSAALFTAFNGKLLFRATTGTTAGNTGAELWETDGTTAGTVLLKDINSGTLNSSPTNFTLHNGKLYFGATTAAAGSELWSTDGTAANTVLVKDIVSGQGPNSPGGSTTGSIGMISNGSTLLFQGIDQSTLPGPGWELYSATGASGNGGILKDINTSSGGANSAPGHFAYPGSGSTVLFTAIDGTYGTELFKSDGTSSGTVLVKDITTGSEGTSFTPLIVFNGKVYFTAYDASAGVELWQTDGTTAGTIVLKDINAGLASSTPLNLTVCGSYLYFSADNGTAGRELWRTDGTANGTVLVSDINTGAGSSNPAYFQYYAQQQKLFFAAYTPANGMEVWQYDGTSSSLYSEAAPGAASSHVGPLMLAGSQLAYVGTNGSTGLELYGAYIYNIWTGANGTTWGTGGSWTQSQQPGTTEGALIPAAGVTAEPSLTTTDVTVTRLEVAAPRTLTIGTGRTLTATDTVMHYGTLAGTGTLTTPHFRNAGTVAPGGTSATGILNVSGNFTNAGTLQVALGGTTAGTQYDRLAVSGNIYLDGTIDASIVNSYAPTDGQVIHILTYTGTRTGTFATTNLPAGWGVVYDDATKQVQLLYTQPLALENLEFSAAAAGEDVLVKWTSTDSDHDAEYRVERSTDGRAFSVIGAVVAAAQQPAYSFRDAAAMKTTASRLYYRLQVVGKDGSKDWSRVATIAIASKDAGFTTTVSPNPFSDRIRVELSLSSAGNVSVQLVDVTGRIVATTSRAANAGQDTFELNGLANLPAGVYVVRVAWNGGSQSVRVVKD